MCQKRTTSSLSFFSSLFSISNIFCLVFSFLMIDVLCCCSCSLSSLILPLRFDSMYLRKTLQIEYLIFPLSLSLVFMWLSISSRSIININMGMESSNSIVVVDDGETKIRSNQIDSISNKQFIKR